MATGTLGRWQFEYPIGGKDWDAILVYRDGHEMVFGVDSIRSNGSDGTPAWRLRSLIRPRRMSNDLPQAVRVVVREAIKQRPL